MSHAKPQPPEYEKAKETDGCSGCVGEHSGLVCGSLPAGCSSEHIIWVDARTPQQRYVAALEQDIG